MKKILGTIVVTLVSTVFALTLLEFSVRIIIGVPQKEILPVARVKPDPDTGWVMLPLDEHYTYGHFVKLNSLGFRGPEVSAKDKNEYRILAIGDSHIYGQGVADNELMTTVLQKKLDQSALPCSYTVTNMGVRAYSTNNELALLKKSGLALDPDHVIVFFFINDFDQVDIASRYSRYANFDWYAFDFSDKPTDKIIQRWKLRQLARRSAALMWIYDIYKGWDSKDNAINKILLGQVDAALMWIYDIYKGWDSKDNAINKILLGQVDNTLQSEIETTIELLNEFRGLSQAHGFRLTLAVIPVAAQINNDYQNQRYQTTLKKYSDEVHLDYLDLLPAFRKHQEQGNPLPVIAFDGHYDAEGHRVMANSVFKHLKEIPGNCK
jgi:lysophospholipase L1-like esterase